MVPLSESSRFFLPKLRGRYFTEAQAQQKRNLQERDGRRRGLAVVGGSSEVEDYVVIIFLMPARIRRET